MVIHLVENFKSEECYAAKYRYQTEACTYEKGMTQTQEMKTFFA